MNARSNTFEFSLEGRQVNEAVSGLFHTLLFYRSTGKYHYTDDGTSFGTGCIGFQDVNCDFVDFTYVRASSDELASDVRHEVGLFSNALRRAEGQGGAQEGQISLEFFQKKRSRWFMAETIPWEIWIVKIKIVNLSNEAERQRQRCTAGDFLQSAVLQVITTMDNKDYVPRVNAQEDLDLIFNTSYSDIQPYHYKVGYQTSFEPSSPSIPSTVRRIFRDTFAV